MRRAFETVRIRCYTLNPSYYSKLSTFGIKDPLLTWFHSYLTGRSQRVVINGTSSRWTDVGSGVPQGSQLGPIPFLLFVNDMPNVVTSATLAMFADDSFLKGDTRHASSGLHLKLNACRTSSFRDFYFNRITLMWNSLPKNIKDSDTISSFKSKLKSFYFTRLLNAFDGDNFHSFKLICPKCRRVNTSSVCTC